MAVTVADVEALDAQGWQHLDSAKKTALLDMAESEADTLYSGRVSRLPTLEGNKEDFIKLLAAHKFELAEGGEAQSESSTGGSVSYNTVTGDRIDGLSETRYGRQASEYLRSKQSISIVKTF